MKFFAYYDLEGNIQSVISVEAEEGAFAMRAPQPGQFVAEIEIEGLELSADASDPEILLEIAENYTAKSPLPRLKLAKKPTRK
ncbi:MAG TPA: hypothetical protein VFZ76_06440 [Anaerolineales bacterium]